MIAATAGTPLVGRDSEQAAVNRLIAGARNGLGGALFISGEPGMGKTALLLSTVAGHAGVDVVRVDGYEAESTIPFAAVQRLAIPLSDYVPSLQNQHQQALRVAVGEEEGPAPDRFLVGLAVLGLLAAAGAGGPLLCTFDDANLLDAESLEVFAFVARRLEAESAAMLFAGRDRTGLEVTLSGVPAIRLPGLATAPASMLLMASLDVPIHPAAAAQISAAVGGNPLALIDLAQDLSVKQLSGLSLGGEPTPIGHRLEAHYVKQVRQLSPPVQDWVLLAAADSTSNIAAVSMAAKAMGLPWDAGDQAERAGLVVLTDRVRFRHPLVRSAAYTAASGADRRRAHAALAEAAAVLGLVEVEAWQASQATLGLDAAVADRLEHVADLAARRGGLISRARVLSRAAALTVPGHRRQVRLLAAAEAALGGGAAPVAQQLVDEIDETFLDGVARGRLIKVESELALFAGDSATLKQSPAAMLAAADCFHGRDVDLEQSALIRAFELCANTDRMMTGVTLPDLGRRLEAGARLAHGAQSDLLHGAAALILLPYEEAVPVIRLAVAALRDLPDNVAMRLGTIATALTTALWDRDGREIYLGRAAAAARAAGSIQVLDTVLWISALAELTGGTVQRAVQYNEQVRELRRAIGYDAENVVNAALMAFTGVDPDLVMIIAQGAAEVGFGGVTVSAHSALAIRDLAEGRYAEAHGRLEPMVATPFLHTTPLTFPDFVEAAARSGHVDQARSVADHLGQLAAANESGWCAGLAARSRAVAYPDDAAEANFVEAIQALAQTDAQIDRGRTHLLYGEWLRRARRRRDARTQLRAASDCFAAAGCGIFDDRVQAELAAAGASMATAAPHEHFDLTNQEATVARLVAEGQTNQEIAAALFISPNTVDYHLRKVFRKVGISSRRQLADRLAGDTH